MTWSVNQNEKRDQSLKKGDKFSIQSHSTHTSLFSSTNNAKERNQDKVHQGLKDRILHTRLQQSQFLLDHGTRILHHHEIR